MITIRNTSQTSMQYLKEDYENNRTLFRAYRSEDTTKDIGKYEIHILRIEDDHIVDNRGHKISFAKVARYTFG